MDSLAFARYERLATTETIFCLLNEHIPASRIGNLKFQENKNCIEDQSKSECGKKGFRYGVCARWMNVIHVVCFSNDEHQILMIWQKNWPGFGNSSSTELQHTSSNPKSVKLGVLKAYHCFNNLKLQPDFRVNILVVERQLRTLALRADKLATQRIKENTRTEILRLRPSGGFRRPRPV